MSEFKKEKIPSYLVTPPSLPEIISPPSTKLQELPLESISWEFFEKLCLRLAREQSEVEFCRLYGKLGDNQAGIDLYARSHESDKYIVYQCKREKKFGPKKIEKAVDRFLDDDWVDKTETFVLCTSESLSSRIRTVEVEKQRVRLDKKGIKLVIWDVDELSTILKSQPIIVNDFFGRHFVELFNGKEVAEQLKTRLDVNELNKLRYFLKSLYEIVFIQHDPGIPTLSTSQFGGIPITDRFIEPDIYEIRQYEASYTFDNDEKEKRYERSKDNEILLDKRLTKGESANYKQRISLSEWVVRSKKSILLGDPGSGKSTFLRFLALDLLSDKPTLDKVALNWGGYIPVWLPFGYWTKIIEQSPSSDFSLSEFLKKWLRNWDEERVWPLLEHALEDERLILLVDGLDEWTNESSGTLALQRLHVFVKQRNVPAIVTSRPYGYSRLQFQDMDWQTGKLADFNKKQQENLIELWFKIWNKDLNTDAISIQTEVDNFLSGLQRAADLQELAKIPLLLSLLITLRIQNARLPANRFLAYDRLVELLITTHPKRRRQAAVLDENFLKDLSNTDLKDILSNLAQYILEERTEGVIEVSNAINVIESYLNDDEQGLGLSKRDARRLSRQIVDVGQSELGIIVQVSPDEIAFFHRTILQYLAAFNIAKLSYEKQKETIISKCVNLQWYETILALFYLTRQINVVRQIINSIKDLKVDKIDERKIQLLLSEIAFGDFNCSPSLTRELCSEIFDEIELGSWMPHRERLLNRALNGLQSSKSKNQVEEKVYEWFPSRIGWRPSLYEAMSNWPADEHTFECLWRGLHDEELANMRAAGKTLSRLFAIEDDVLKKVSSLATSDTNIDTKAAAIETLILGWPEDEKTRNIIEEARQSLSPQINLLGIFGSIKTKNIDSKLEEETFKLFTKYLGYEWKDLMVQVILEGYPKENSFKKSALDSLTTYKYQPGGMDQEVAYQVLLAGYPGDPDVVDFCALEIKSEEFPFSSFYKGNFWKLLEKNFKNESKIVEAVEENRSKFEHDPISLSYSALIGRTGKDKKALIDYYKNKSFPFWAASALLKGWGINDYEVKSLLEKDAWGETRRASQIGHLLPEIIYDKKECKKRLLEVLNAGNNIRYDFVTEGLVEVAKGKNDKEIVDSLVEIIEKKEETSYYLDTAKAKLIMHFAEDDNVREIALQEFDNRNGNLNAIAIGYSNDNSIRKRIAKIANPLPRRLRKTIIERLIDQLGDITFRKNILSKYDFETDASIKTEASNAYHSLLVTEDSVEQSNLDYLKETIVCYGPDHIERRQAAFCGLTILKRLDIVFEVRERIGDDPTAKISIGDQTKTNIPLLNEILKNWEYLNDTFGIELIQRLGKNLNKENRIWETLSLVADSYPKPREEVLKYIEQAPESSSSLTFINFVARVLPKSNLLLKLCLENLSSSNTGFGLHYEDKSFDVPNILATHFKGNKKVLEELLSKEMNTKIFFALLKGWNESINIDTLLKKYQEKISLNAIIEAHLVSKKENNKVVIEWMRHLLENPIAPYILRTNLFWQPIIKRVRDDADVWDECFSVLTKTNNFHLKISLAHLLNKTNTFDDNLRKWVSNQINNQLNGNKISEDGFDLLSGAYQPLLHVLYQVFDSEIEQNITS